MSGKEIIRPDWGPGGEHRNIVEVEEPVQTVDVIAEMRAWPAVPAGDGAIDPELKARWGSSADSYFAIASAAVTDMCSRVSDPQTFIFKFENQLPKHLQNEIIDRLRIPPAKGRGKAAVQAFEDALSDADLDVFVEWFKDLEPDEQQAIKQFLNGG
jgi:hypothetical protein